MYTEPMTHTEGSWTLVASETTTYVPTVVRPARGSVRREADCRECGGRILYRTRQDAWGDTINEWEHYADGSRVCDRAVTVRHSV